MRAFLLIVAVVVIYFIPSFVAHKKRNSRAIFLLNLFLGWTFLGWVGALVWASIKDPSAAGSEIQPPQPWPKK